MSKIERLRDKAYSETVDLLQLYSRAVIVRPTGFGKTGILTRLIHDYHKIIYFYPTEIIRDAVLLFWYGDAEHIPADRTIPGVTFMTYATLARLASGTEKAEDTLNALSGSDLIICDECHRVGAIGTSEGLDALLRRLPHVHMVGATATPERMDTIDEVARFFDDRTISEYTLHDAFVDGILQRPYYYYFEYLNAADEIKQLKKEAEAEIKKVDGADNRMMLAQHLKSSLVQISNLANMAWTIKKVCHQYAFDENYMRFIAFFSCFDEVETNGEKVRAWLHEAYPDYQIRELKVTSETDETRENAEKIKALKKQDKTIDLILSCNMMNMGYHVDSLTGIFMYRGTQSGTIYTQQLGRVLTSGSEHHGICFDVVDNIHTPSMYQLLGKPSENLIWRRKRQKKLIKKKALHDAAVAVQNGESDPEVLQAAFPDLTETEVIDIIRCPDTDSYVWTEADDRELKNLNKHLKAGPRKGRTRTTLEPEDLIGISSEATYRDLIRKTVAEAKSMRCRQAWARWLEEGGKATSADGRPLSRKEVLKQTPPENIPLPPFCYAKQVSVDAVLREMGVPDDDTTLSQLNSTSAVQQVEL